MSMTNWFECRDLDPVLPTISSCSRTRFLGVDAGAGAFGFEWREVGIALEPLVVKGDKAERSADGWMVRSGVAMCRSGGEGAMEKDQ